MDEAQHDKDVAPLLLEAAKAAQSHGGSVVAFSEFVNGEGNLAGASTVAICKGVSASMRLAHLAIMCRGNVDGLIMALIKGHREGAVDCSQSIFLHNWLKDEAPNPSQ